jgi:hypothetical protein
MNENEHGKNNLGNKNKKKNEKNMPDPDPEILYFSSGTPFFCPVAHLTCLAMAHHESSSCVLLGAPLLSQIAMAHHWCVTPSSDTPGCATDSQYRCATN